MKITAIFTAEGGYQAQKDLAKKQLVIGQEYYVEYVEVGSSYTYIWLKGFEGSFNSCLFDVDYYKLDTLAKSLGTYPEEPY